MADFEVPVVRIEAVIPIEGADRIEAVRIGGYQSIVEKGKYRVGDLAVYIPCSSLVPYSLQEEMGLVGKLSGNKKNRVKEIKLKGVLSEGLVYSFESLIAKWQSSLPATKEDVISGWRPPLEGDNVAAVLGVEKWEPEIPATMKGQVKPYPFTMAYDIENYKKYNRALEPYEFVVFSEKIHGTLLQVGLVHNDDGSVTKFVTSKGLGKAGIIIQDNEANAENLYLRTAKLYGLLDKLDQMDLGQDLYIFGEIFGKNGQSNIQDLTYTDSVSGEPQYRAFDIYEGKKGKGRWLDVEDFAFTCEAMGIPTVNYLYRGPFTPEVLEIYTKGRETMSGHCVHIREGIVIRPLEERTSGRLGRVILKSVSEDYLLRKGGTEFN